MKLSRHTTSINLRFGMRSPLALATLFSVLTVSAPLMAADFSVSGESSTILRMGTTIDDKNLYPAYEYLNMGMSGKLADGATLGLYMGAWGRVDLGDKSTSSYTDTDLQYFYLSYKAAKNNSVVNLGRQFVTEGVAAEKLDGLYARHDFAAGFGASAYVGQPVTTEANYESANLVYGGRISHTMPNLYTLGISALKSEADHDSQYREEEGIDLWLHPHQMVDLTGRSAYNSITDGWMEHAYTLTISPLANLKISTSLTNINYSDYYYNMTTSALNLNNGFIKPGEEMLAVGAGISYTFLKNLTLSADYKNYNYDIVGSADYYGGKVAYFAPEIITAGFGYHRMDGDNDRLSYDEYRLYAQKKIGHLDLAADFINVHYDKTINDISSSYTVTGAVGYEINRKLKVGGDIEYSRNPDFDDEMRGLVKLTYLFDTKFSEGRGSSEK